MPSEGERHGAGLRAGGLCQPWGAGPHPVEPQPSPTVETLPGRVDDGQVVAGAAPNHQIEGAPLLYLQEGKETSGEPGAATAWGTGGLTVAELLERDGTHHQDTESLATHRTP